MAYNNAPEDQIQFQKKELVGIWNLAYLLVKQPPLLVYIVQNFLETTAKFISSVVCSSK